MPQQIEQAGPVIKRVGQRDAGAQENFSSRLTPTAANDNNCEGPWQLVPFPEGLAPIPDGQCLSMQDVGSSLLWEGNVIPQPGEQDIRPSWTANRGRLAYLATVSIVMFCWLYLLWLALAYGVDMILG
jgi:hypothetical protein